MFDIGVSGGEGNLIGYLSVVCIAASLLWFESTEIWEEVQSVDRFGYKWQMTTMALVGSAHPTFRSERMAGHVADKIRSYHAAPELIWGFSTKADIRSEEWLCVMVLCACRPPV